jgi:sugar phosphate isomerase/epimerase
MKISTEIASAARILGEQRAVELIAKAGFDAWDFSMFSMPRYSKTAGKMIITDHPLCTDNYAAFAKELRKIGEDCGIVCNQSHAPFPSLPVIYDYLKRAIECTAIAGGEVCIIHPDNNKSAEENAEMYFELLPFAKEHGVKIATENMWNWNKEKDEASAAACSHHDDFVKHIKAVNDPYLVACLDIGHAEMAGLDTTAPTMIKALGDSLQALHIHDNDKLGDSHQIPFSMKIDWNSVAKALKEANYKGHLTLEADRYIGSKSITTEQETLDALKDLHNAVKRLDDLIQNS